MNDGWMKIIGIAWKVIKAGLWLGALAAVIYAWSKVTVVTPAFPAVPLKGDTLPLAKALFTNEETRVPPLYTNIEVSNHNLAKIGGMVLGLFTKCRPFVVPGKNFMKLNVGLDQYGAVDCLPADRIVSTIRDVTAKPADENGAPISIHAGQRVQVTELSVDEDGLIGIASRGRSYRADPVFMGLIGKPCYISNCMDGERVASATMGSYLFERGDRDVILVKGVIHNVRKGCRDEIRY